MAAAALAALLPLHAAADAPVVAQATWGVSAGPVHRRLVERADDGSRLLEESGPLLRLSLQGQLPLAGGGAVSGQAAVATGDLDYEGRTQGGTPVGTRTGHRDLEASVAWRPWAPAGWGEAWLSLRALEQRRQIASTPRAIGLHETSTLWMPGLRWMNTFESGGWQWQPSVALHASVRHRLQVRYGSAFDASDLKGGRRTDLLLGLAASSAGSPWRWSIEWSHARQPASDWQPLYRSGLRAGNVRQPRIEIDDVAVRVTREF